MRAVVAAVALAACRAQAPSASDARPAVVAVDAAVPRPRVEPVPPPPGWADVAIAIPDAVLDLRYATTRNVLGRPFAPARCLLRAHVAARLVRAAATLRAAGDRLVLWDCYRTPGAQAALWAHRPDHRYVAKPHVDARGVPTSGSRHTRGTAVDVSLADVPMPTDHDEFSAAAHRSRALAGDGDAARHARALDAAMTAVGFVGVASEWWHYDVPDGASSPLADLDLVPKEPAP